MSNALLVAPEEIQLVPANGGYRVCFSPVVLGRERFKLTVDAMRAVRDEVTIAAFQFDGEGWFFRDHARERVLPHLTARFPHLAEAAKNVTILPHPASAALAKVGLRRPLYVYQEQAVQVLWDAGGNEIVAMAPGTGKTAVSIAYGETQDGPKIVVCPKSVQQQWADELMVLTGKVANVVRGTAMERQQLLWVAMRHDWTIITYEGARELAALIAQMQFGGLYVDEAQYLKNPNAQRTRAVLGSLHKFTAAERKELLARGDKREYEWRGGVQTQQHIMLSGTPMLSRPIELYPLLRAVDSWEWRSFKQFKERYCGKQTIQVPDMRYTWATGEQLAAIEAGTLPQNERQFLLMPGEWRPRRNVDTFSGASNMSELHGRLQKYYHRVKLADALPHLPELVQVDLRYDLSAEQRKSYDKALLTFEKFLAEEKGKTDEEIARTMQAAALAKIGHLRIEATKAKVGGMMEMIDTVLEGWGGVALVGEDGRPKASSKRTLIPDAAWDDDRESVLVFSTYKEPLELLAKVYGPLARKITGDEKGPERDAAREAFQRGEFPILLLTHAAGGVGLNLQRARIVFMLNEDWNPSQNEQAIARAHRNGQKDGVTVYTLIATDTVDESVHETLEYKSEVIAQVLDGKSAEEEQQKRRASALAKVLRELRAEVRRARARLGS